MGNHCLLQWVYADYSFEVNATEENIVKSADDTEISTDALQAAIEKAETLKEEDYTKESWSAFQMELDESKRRNRSSTFTGNSR